MGQHEDAKLLEYRCQVILGTLDLHIKLAWTLVSPEESERFQQVGAELRGPLVFSLLDIEDLLPFAGLPGASWSEVFLRRGNDFDWRRIPIPVGARKPPGARLTCDRRYLLCRVALGKIRQIPLEDADMGETLKRASFPDGFSSLLLPISLEGEEESARYLVRDAGQVLPLALCELGAGHKEVNATSPLCSMCQRSRASVYCFNDNAHFCAQCDSSHHSQNDFFARHRRVPAEQSPHQFGRCQYHSSDHYECVCLDCMVLLCPRCVLTGPHSDPQLAHHRLISTMDAFRDAMQGRSASDHALEQWRARLRQDLAQRRGQLTDLHTSFEEVKHELDAILRRALGQVSRAQSRRTEFVHSVKRQVLSRVLFMEWLESFLEHARLALPAADYLVAVQRHENLVASLFEDEDEDASDMLGPMPRWMEEELTVEGSLSLRPCPDLPPSPELQAEASERLRAAFGGAGGASPVPHKRWPASTSSQGFDDARVEPSGNEFSQASERERSPELGGGIHASRAESLYTQTLSFLQRAERQLPEAPLERARFSMLQGDVTGGISSSSGTPFLPTIPSRKTSDDPRLERLSTVFVELRRETGLAPGHWGQALALLGASAASERVDLVASVLAVASQFGVSDVQLVRRIVEEDVRAAQLPSLIASAHGVFAALVAALMRLVSKQMGALKNLVVAMLQEVTTSRDGAVTDVVDQALSNFLYDFGELAATQDTFPQCLVATFHFLWGPASDKFGANAATNALVTLLVSRILAPCVLRAAQPLSVEGQTGNVKTAATHISRRMQQAAHVAHEDGGDRSPQLRAHVRALRDLVKDLQTVPFHMSLELRLPAEVAENAAERLVPAFQFFLGTAID